MEESYHERAKRLDNESTFSRLETLHSQIKSHPYRMSGDLKYLKTYTKLLYDLSTCFFWVVRRTKYSRAGDMCHDFNGAIGNLGREGYSYESDVVYHIEMCLGVIHHFIDTHEVPVFYEYYTGCNILESLPRHEIFLFNKETEKYRLKLTEKQVKDAIYEIDKHYNHRKDRVWDEYGIYSKEEYEFLQTYLK